MNYQHKYHTKEFEQEVVTYNIAQPFGIFKRVKRLEHGSLNLSGLCFEFHNGYMHSIEGVSYIVIGRQADNQQPIDFDLSPYGGLEQGVSRTHCVIQITPESVFVRDLNSSNCTFLNNAELFAMRDYPIQDGDELRLGRLTIRIRFLQSSM